MARSPRLHRSDDVICRTLIGCVVGRTAAWSTSRRWSCSASVVQLSNPLGAVCVSNPLAEYPCPSARAPRGHESARPVNWSKSYRGSALWRRPEHGWMVFVSIHGHGGVQERKEGTPLLSCLVPSSRLPKVGCAFLPRQTNTNFTKRLQPWALSHIPLARSVWRITATAPATSKQVPSISSAQCLVPRW